MDVTAQLRQMDPATFEPVVRRQLNCDTAIITTCQIAPLGGGFGANLGGAVPHRLSGTAFENGTERSWSLVLKILTMPASATQTFNHLDPGGMFYWKREALLYRSTLLDELPTGFAAPHCYGTDDRADEIWLWLEDINPPPSEPWSVSRYGEAARHIGRYNGAYLTGRTLPEQPWLCRDLLRWRQAIVSPLWEQIFTHHDDVQALYVWPRADANRAYRVWLDRDIFFGVLDRMPHVMCHGDTDRRNLISRDIGARTETVAIDWGCAGPRALGSDLTCLVIGSMMWSGDREPADLPELDRTCFAAYLLGLHEAGWLGDERIVRLGYAATAALQFCALAGALRWGFASEEERPRMEAAVRMSLETVLARHVAMQPFVLGLADEARVLNKSV